MDIWRSGFVCAPLADVLAAGDLDRFELHWLPGPERRYSFLADPFGVVRDGMTHIFVEAFDYRDRRGRIEVLTYGADMELLQRTTCLAEPWHLSYPAPIAWQGEDYLLPEAHRSGGLTLYRATDFPRQWEATRRIELPHVAVDATPIFHDGLWWLFYSTAGNNAGELHLAFAEHLIGPWRPHPDSPVRSGLVGSRPGGRASHVGNRIVLPVQDCSRTYGGAIRPLWIDRLTPDRFDAEVGIEIKSPTSFAPFTDGLHTLSGCGELTLFDVKRIDRSLAGRVVGLIGKARRAAGISLPLPAGTGSR